MRVEASALRRGRSDREKNADKSQKFAPNTMNMTLTFPNVITVRFKTE